MREVRQLMGSLKNQAEKGLFTPGPVQGENAQQFAEVIKRFKDLGSQKYSSTYDCGRYTLLDALRRHARMECPTTPQAQLCLK